MGIHLDEGNEILIDFDNVLRLEVQTVYVSVHTVVDANSADRNVCNNADDLNPHQR